MTKFFLTVVFYFLIHLSSAQNGPKIQGAWVKVGGNLKTLALITDQLISVAVYNEKEKQFLYTWGGTYVLQSSQLQVQYEWSSNDSNLVNTSSAIDFNIKRNKLSLGETLAGLERSGGNQSEDLQGAWIISGNYIDGVAKKRANPFLPRRTMKLIVGDYFQWVSYNVVSKKFFDAGGGKQSHGNGQYNEEIEYFTKTPASIGKKMNYTYSISGDDWRHTGQKSTGGLLDECWTRRRSIELLFHPAEK